MSEYAHNLGVCTCKFDELDGEVGVQESFDSNGDIIRVSALWPSCDHNLGKPFVPLRKVLG